MPYARSPTEDVICYSTYTSTMRDGITIDTETTDIDFSSEALRAAHNMFNYEYNTYALELEMKKIKKQVKPKVRFQFTMEVGQ